MSGLPFDVVITIYDCLIFQLCREWGMRHIKGKRASAKLVGHINKSKKQAQQLDRLRDEIYTLDKALRRTHRNDCSLAETLQKKLEEKD